MAKSIKLKDNKYWDSNSIVHNRELLSTKVINSSGSNSNGNWIKFEDGTMICYKRQTFSNTPITNTWGNVVESGKLDIGNFPQAFVGPFPDIFIMPWQPFFVERAYSESRTSWGSFYAVRPGGAGGTMDVAVSCFAIGKWK